MHHGRRWLRMSLASAVATSFAVIGSVGGGCAEILGVNDDTESAIAQICKCTQLDTYWPKDGTGESFYTCNEYVTAALAADPEAARSWLAVFDQAGCDTCEAVEACAKVAPLCVQPGGWCNTDASCCGHDPERPTANYCALYESGGQVPHTCVSDPDPDGCVKPGDGCKEGAECCGFSGGLADCALEAGVCIAECDPENPILCPGCCGIVSEHAQPPTWQYYICVDSLPYDETGGVPKCGKTCTESCSLGFGCGFRERVILVPGPGDQLNMLLVNVSECLGLPGN